jgi:hypothetical protein
VLLLPPPAVAASCWEELSVTRFLINLELPSAVQNSDPFKIIEYSEIKQELMLMLLRGPCVGIAKSTF